MLSASRVDSSLTLAWLLEVDIHHGFQLFKVRDELLLCAATCLNDERGGVDNKRLTILLILHASILVGGVVGDDGPQERSHPVVQDSSHRQCCWSSLESARVLGRMQDRLSEHSLVAPV